MTEFILNQIQPNLLSNLTYRSSGPCARSLA